MCLYLTLGAAYQTNFIGRLLAIFKNRNRNESSEARRKRLLVCGLTKLPLRDPVIAEDGRTYERSVILDYFREKMKRGEPVVSPTTQEPMEPIILDNFVIKSFLDRNNDFCCFDESPVLLPKTNNQNQKTEKLKRRVPLPSEEVSSGIDQCLQCIKASVFCDRCRQREIEFANSSLERYDSSFSAFGPHKEFVIQKYTEGGLIGLIDFVEKQSENLTTESMMLFLLLIFVLIFDSVLELDILYANICPLFKILTQKQRNQGRK